MSRKITRDLTHIANDLNKAKHRLNELEDIDAPTISEQYEDGDYDEEIEYSEEQGDISIMPTDLKIKFLEIERRGEEFLRDLTISTPKADLMRDILTNVKEARSKLTLSEGTQAYKKAADVLENELYRLHILINENEIEHRKKMLDAVKSDTSKSRIEKERIKAMIKMHQVAIKYHEGKIRELKKLLKS